MARPPTFFNVDVPLVLHELIRLDIMLFKMLYLKFKQGKKSHTKSLRDEAGLCCLVTMVAGSLEGWSREVTRGGELLLGHVIQAGWLDMFWQAVRGSRSKAENLWQRLALWWSVSSKPLLASFVVSIERDLDKFGYLTSSEVSRLAGFGRQSHSAG